MERTFSQWMEVAKSVYETTRDMDRDHATVEIMRQLTEAYSEGGHDAIDKMQERLSVKH